ncbi:MAG: D-tyrosyl-tRNA(Tyr) deacylase [Calditrichaeota bacterium]|nr:MAG: D-tyrosyl-tRNA(Tyr) deacylase [Calditrichota bacterium]MBL1204137.1 D-tyrosyl-tRNA(Tyr) deacylase [Calditrichota bacterium]NOG43968.1 D-tyrosyl-tRNA(Tyr) deacylase [Calditrichota bacterium]
MKVLLQRVSTASVSVDSKIVGKINNGLLLLIGIGHEDSEADLDWMADKCVNLRVFEDADDKMNCSLLDVNAEILAISQFTLMGDTRKGRRPSFINAASPEMGEKMYNLFVDKLKSFSIKVECGIFGAMMDVQLTNRGPVTLMLEK